MNGSVTLHAAYCVSLLSPFHHDTHHLFILGLLLRGLSLIATAGSTTLMLNVCTSRIDLNAMVT
jgi:hypothetical protein